MLPNVTTPTRSLTSRAALLLAALCVAAVFAACAHAPLSSDRRVLVMTFDNSVPENPDANLGKSLADMLTANLANYPHVAVVERQDNPAANGRDWQAAGKSSAVDYVIVGSISKLNNNFVLNARLLSCATGEIVKGSSVTRSCDREEDLYPLVQAEARVLAQHLGVLAERYEAWVAQGR